MCTQGHEEPAEQPRCWVQTEARTDPRAGDTGEGMVSQAWAPPWGQLWEGATIHDPIFSLLPFAGEAWGGEGTGGTTVAGAGCAGVTLPVPRCAVSQAGQLVSVFVGRSSWRDGDLI